MNPTPLVPLFRSTTTPRPRPRFRNAPLCLSRRCTTDFSLAAAARFGRSRPTRAARFGAFALAAPLHRRTPRRLAPFASCGCFLAPTGRPLLFRFRPRAGRTAQTNRFSCGSTNWFARRSRFAGDCPDHAADDCAYWTANAAKHRTSGCTGGGLGNWRDGDVFFRWWLFARF